MSRGKTKAGNTEKAGTAKDNNVRTDSRLLPYYCSWYRGIFGLTEDSEANGNDKTLK
jgi:hypothetical protein